MPDLSFCRLSLDCRGLIFSLVKKERQTNMKQQRLPTPGELYALEQWAYRERSRAIARLIVAGAHALKALLARAVATRAPTAEEISRQVVRHA